MSSNAALLNQVAHELLQISEPAAHRPDYVQGAGGNTSAKATDGTMAIKASGYELRQLDLHAGMAWVMSPPVAAYFQDIETVLASPADYEAITSALVKEHTFTPEPWPAARPSMETGFHSILQRYVVHTHSVYSNLINCREDGEQLLAQFAEQYGLDLVWIPYYNPGFWLTTAIKASVDKAVAAGKAMPKVFFLQNHGIIVTAPTVDELTGLHREINALLCEFFQLVPSQYPAAIIAQKTLDNDQQWTSQSEFVIEFMRTNPDLTAAFFEANVLFPDQTVFFNENFSFDDEPVRKIHVNKATGQVTYHTNFREARTIDETLTAYLYIRSNILHHGGTPRMLQPADLAYINGMESEAFRKSLMK